MKLINMIIYRAWKKELDEIRDLLEEAVQKEKGFLRESFEYAHTPEEFFSLKDKIRKLDEFSFQLDSENILDIDFYGDNPLFILEYKKKICGIIEKALQLNT